MRYLSPGNRVTAGNRVTPGNRLSRARGGVRRVMTSRDETDGCHLPEGNLPFNPLGQDATCLAKMPTLAPDNPWGRHGEGFTLRASKAIVATAAAVGSVLLAAGCASSSSSSPAAAAAGGS